MPLPQNQSKAPVWVMGVPQLESMLLDWFVMNFVRPEMPLTVVDHELRSGLTRDRLESLLRTKMLFRRDASKLQQFYTFFTKNLVRDIQNHADKISVLEPSLYGVLCALEFREESSVHMLDVLENRYLNTRDTPNSRVAMTFSCPSVTGGASYQEYLLLSRENDGMILGIGLTPSTIVRWTDDWVSNPDRVRLPNRVIESMQRGSTEATYKIISPDLHAVQDRSSFILDWLHSDSAPKNLSKLSFVDANRLATEWHEANTRRRNAAMRAPVDMGIPPLGIDFGTQGGMNVFMAGRQAGRTTQFREMFALEEARRQVAATPKYYSVEVTEADYTLIWERDGWKVYALESHAAFQKESELMGHCIGESPRYWRMKEDDPHHYIAMTLRTPEDAHSGVAAATFDYYPTRGFIQLKGKSNEKLTRGASDAFLLFLEDISRFGIEYLSPLFNGSEENYANSMTFPMIYSAKREEGSIADVFHGTIEAVRNYLDNSVNLPEPIKVLLHPVTRSNIKYPASFVQGVRFVPGEESTRRVGGRLVDEVAPTSLYAHQVLSIVEGELISLAGRPRQVSGYEDLQQAAGRLFRPSVMRDNLPIRNEGA